MLFPWLAQIGVCAITLSKRARSSAHILHAAC